MAKNSKVTFVNVVTQSPHWIRGHKGPWVGINRKVKGKDKGVVRFYDDVTPSTMQRLKTTAEASSGVVTDHTQSVVPGWDLVFI